MSTLKPKHRDICSANNLEKICSETDVQKRAETLTAHKPSLMFSDQPVSFMAFCWCCHLCVLHCIRIYGTLCLSDAVIPRPEYDPTLVERMSTYAIQSSVLELCAGSGIIGHAFHSLNIHCLGIDRVNNGFRPLSHL